MVSKAKYLLVGLIAAISLLAVPVKHRNKGFRGEWLIAGLAIGIISPIIGLYLGNILGIFLPGHLPDGPFVQVFLILLLFIVSSIVYTYLKKESAVYFMKLLFFSFIVVLFSAYALFLIGQSGGVTIIVEKISIESQINGMNDYVNITEKELDEYPALKKAIIECRDFNNCNSEPNIEEWMSTRGFLDKKAHESGYLFSVMDERSEEDLNKGIFSSALRNAFESRGLLLSENAFISQASYQEVIRWNIIDKKHLFDIKDVELENELEKIDITTGEFKNTKISKLDQIFKAKGFLSSENYTIYRIPENWIIFNDTVQYGIQKENGILKVYTVEKGTYEIWKENGKLNIYHAKLSASYLLKIAGNYYKISEQWE